MYNPYYITSNVLKTVKFKTDDHWKEIDEIVKHKTRLALWIVSNCSPQERMILSEDLVKTGMVHIDRRGRCFPNELAATRELKEQRDLEAMHPPCSQFKMPMNRIIG